MTKKRITSLAIALMLIIGMFAMMPTAAAVTDEVSLIYAETKNATGGVYLKGYVEVENLGYNKEVTINYFNSYDMIWTTVEATYVGPTYGNYEAWYFETPAVYNPNHRASTSYTFAIEYTVNNVTYWDNNGGDDYYVLSAGYTTSYSSATVFGTGKLFLRDAEFYDGGTINVLRGTIHINNLGYNKNVFVRYTTDNWATYTDAAAGYESTYPNFNYSGPSNVERWGFLVNLPIADDSIEFAIGYTVNGETYWDNNFGENYSYEIPVV
ncbi:MAG: CBM21 domain-containing protein [Oscillospiraceae bacterium]|jgi:hypothetical protein|nr:CBM21 domain-containing protein [Oscillospiraceae bacterium]